MIITELEKQTHNAIVHTTGSVRHVDPQQDASLFYEKSIE